MSKPKYAYIFVCTLCNGSKTLFLNPESVQEWRAGALIQHVFPDLSKADRELMISSTCEKCFEKLFAGEEDSL